LKCSRAKISKKINYIKSAKSFSAKDGYLFHNNLSSCSYINVIYLFCIIHDITTQTLQKAPVQWLTELINLINQLFWRVSSLYRWNPSYYIITKYYVKNSSKSLYVYYISIKYGHILIIIILAISNTTL